MEEDSGEAAAPLCAFRLEIRKDIDYSILGISMVMLSLASKMGVDHRRPIGYMGMREQGDTCIINAEYQHQAYGNM